MDLPVENQEPLPAQEHSMYSSFVSKLVEYGKIHWRVHNINTDILSMNDIDLSSGIFQKNKFIHVTRVLDNNTVS